MLSEKQIKQSKEYYNDFKDIVERDGNKLITLFEIFIKLREGKRSNNLVSVILKCGKCKSEYSIIITNYKRSTRCCSKCSNNGKLTLEELRNRINKKGLKLISDVYTGETCTIEVECQCGNRINTTYASIRNSNDIILCQDCHSKNKRNIYKTPFEEIRKYYEDNGCVLLSLEEEYDNAFSKLKFIGTCGHEHISSYESFKYISKYKMCPECTIKMNSGENTYNWNSNLTQEEREKGRDIEGYNNFVKEVYKRDDYTCKCCGEYAVKLNAHHLNGYNWDKKHRVDVNNGVTLCEECHKEFHSIYGYGDNTKEQFEEWIEEGNGVTENYTIILN